MQTDWTVEIDFIEELQLRRWARENFVAADEREASWHPIILEEMSRKDQEVGGSHEAMPLFAGVDAR